MTKFPSKADQSRADKILTTFLFLLLGFFGLAGGVEAANHYVSPTGSATWAQATDINTPTNSQTAFANAQAGDVVYFRGGTYTVPQNNNKEGDRSAVGVYNVAHSGTSGNYITFQAYPGETPVLNGTVGGSSDIDGYLTTILSILGHSYIVVDGFTFQANNGTYGARIVIDGLTSSTPPYTGAAYITIRNCIFDGGSTYAPVGGSNNRDGVRLGKADHVTIKNNIIKRYRESSNNHNTSAYKSYWTTYTTLTNNEIYDNSAGIYMKNGNDYAVVKNNYIHDNANFGIEFVADAGSASSNNEVSNNVIVNSYGVMINGEAGLIGSNNSIFHNTIHMTSVSNPCLYAGNSTSFSIHSNLIYGCSSHQFGCGNNTTFTEMNYNQFGDSTFQIECIRYTNSYSTLSLWQVSTSPVNHPDTNSLASNPLFTNGSGNYSLLSDFTLTSNSPCIGTGKDGVDMGADIDLVGVNAGQAQPICGDGSCNGTETCSSCSSDCGTCIDTTPPSISNGSPNGTLPAGTTQTTMSVSTNENATCRWSSAAGVTYSSMPNTFSTTGATTHSITITGLSNGQTYNRYVRCQDTAGNANTSDYLITFSIASSEGTTITLYPTQDTYIDLNTETNISNTALNTYTWPANQIANAVLMKFNLSSIPSNANIQDAKLYLYLTAADTNISYPTYTNTLHRIINHNPNLSLATGYTYDGANPWTASSCCYNNTPLAQADISSAYDIQQVNKTLGFKSWNAAQLIKDWLSNPSANYGLLINSDSAKPADTYRTFASSEYATTSYRPYLEITYTLSVDTTSPAAPTGLTVD